MKGSDRHRGRTLCALGVVLSPAPCLSQEILLLPFAVIQHIILSPLLDLVERTLSTDLKNLYQTS